MGHDVSVIVAVIYGGFEDLQALFGVKGSTGTTDEFF